MKIKKNQKGFTLIETLIAMLILVVGILAIAGLQVAAIQSNASAKQATQATIIAAREMDRLRSLGFGGLPAAPSGWRPGTPAVTGGFTTEHRITAVTGLPNLREVKVRVSWTDRGRQREVNLVTLIAR